MPLKQFVCVFAVALLSSILLSSSSYAQVVIKERVEVDQSQVKHRSNQSFTGIGFVAPSDGTLEIDLVSAFRAGFEFYTDISDFVDVQVLVNEQVVLSDKLFTRSWDVTTVQNQVVCGPDVLPGQTYTYTGGDVITVGDVVAGDEVTLRFLTTFALYGAVIDFDLDSSFITEDGDEWFVEFIGNGQFGFVDGIIQCTVPREELRFGVRYGSGSGGNPDIAFVVENPTTSEMETTNNLDIGHWENAYELDSDGSLVLVDGNPVVKNEDADNFVIADADRFYVQVTDPGANIPDPDGNPVQNFITVLLETLTSDGTSDELPQTIVLGESDVDTGVFVSGPQLLVTQNVDTLPDDGFEANNSMASFMDAYEAYALAEGLPIAGTVKNDEATDPTHIATVGGSVEVRYDSPAGSAATGSASVCDPAEIKEVALNFIIVDEPYLDEGFIDSNQEYVAGVSGEFDWEGKDYSIPFEDAYAAYLANPNVPSEAYIDFSTPPEERAGVTPKPGTEQKTGSSWGAVFSSSELPVLAEKIATTWAQACITVSWSEGDVGPVMSSIDGRVDLEEDLDLYEEVASSFFGDGIIEVFIVGDNNQGYGGLAISQEWASGNDGMVDSGDIGYILLSPSHASSQRELELILPHDVGYLLTNVQPPDPLSGEPVPEYILFPRLDHSDDDHYGKSRRLTKETEAAAEGSVFLNDPSN